ncbi:hypothetical protein [Brevundimonas bacteroides]|uniref:hypothetical protein n=1 Tax=Brevundimonas bacteroides TaxID=74311 RepID=UPI001B804522|nr:hypothetical protein [Brevundimonas bacteroides]
MDSVAGAGAGVASPEAVGVTGAGPVMPVGEGAAVGAAVAGGIVVVPIGAVTGAVEVVPAPAGRIGVEGVGGGVSVGTTDNRGVALLVGGAAGRAPPAGGVRVAEGRATDAGFVEPGPAALGVIGAVEGTEDGGDGRGAVTGASEVVVPGRLAAGGAPFSIRVRSLAVLCCG